MIDQVVLISFDHSFLPYPSEIQIREVFESFGEISKVISQRQFKNYFLIWYKDAAGAEQCKKNPAELYKNCGYLIERFDDDLDEAVTFEESIGVADENHPSLMHLNEDCLIHILSFLSNSSPVEFSCVRLRRICRNRWRKVNWVHSTNLNPCIDRIFLYGPKIHHLSLWFPGDLLLTLTLERLVRCNNLETFYLKSISIDPNEQVYHLLEDIFSPLKQLVLNLKYYRNRLARLVTHAPKLEKVSLIFRENTDETRKSIFSCNLDLLNSLTKLKFLTVLIVPLEVVVVDRLLTSLPGLRVLSCIPDQEVTYEQPLSHNLQDFFANIDDDNSAILIDIRRRCPNLRNLRVSGPLSIECLTVLKHQSLPLEGLHLSNVGTLDLDFLSSFANELKVIFIESCSVPKEVFPSFLSNFTKLEVLSWDEEAHGNFADFLSARTAQAPLTVVSRNPPTDEHMTILPSLKWERSRESLFGHFSIYSF